MKKAILLVSFGTSHADARKKSLESIYEELAAVDTQLPVLQAYTSSMIIKKLAGQGITVHTVEEAVQEAVDGGIRCLYVIPTHMIPGFEYRKLAAVLEKYRAMFAQLEIAAPVLAEQEDCEKMVLILQQIFDFQPQNAYILMGHGTEAEANVRYEQMNTALKEAGFPNVKIASVEAKPDLEDAMLALQEREGVEKVIVHPFMVVAGDHAKNDMAGAEDSYVTRLQAAGYSTEAVVKGLGEYAPFRRIYVDRLQRLREPRHGG